MFFAMLLMAAVGAAAPDRSQAAALPARASSQVTRSNRLPPRTAYVPCPTRDLALKIAALKETRDASPFILSLNGKWDFRWAKDPGAEPGAWTTIDVPSCWQLQGLYDPPAGVEPCAMRNPTGRYRREFVLPKRWEGRKTILRFNGVDATLAVKINGADAGCSEDARLPAEFDVSPFVKGGGATNVVEATVCGRCEGDRLENGDSWRLSGICRDVYLVSEPVGGVYDAVVETALSDDFSHASVRLALTGGMNFQRLELVDPKGGTVGATTNAADKIYVRNPQLWNSERPKLYTLVLLADQTFYAFNVGFRRVEIKNDALTVNGRRIRVKGVNRRAMNPHTGCTLTPEDMKRDADLMKKFNVNAVRSCRGPDDPLWYDVCDQTGLWAVCETNAACRNHPSVIALPADAGVESAENLKDAFKWTFADAMLWSTANNNARQAGRPPFLACGGDFGGKPTAARSGGEAMFDALRNPRPVAYAVRDAYRAVFVDECDFANMTATIRNGFVFRDMTGFRCHWQYAVNGVPSYCGSFTLNGLAAGGSRLVNLMDTLRPKPVRRDERIGERTLTFSFVDGGRCEVARLQRRADAWKRRRRPDAATAAWRQTTNDAARVAYAANGVDVAFDRRTGLVTSYRKDGSELFAAPPVMDFWRAPVDADRDGGMPDRCRVWREAGVKAKCVNVAFGETNGFPQVIADYAVPAGDSKARFVQTLTDEGGLRVDWTFDAAAGLPDVPRAGIAFDAPLAFDCVCWYGLGPHETYRDRAEGAWLGIHNAVVGFVDGFSRQSDAFGRPALRYPSARLNPDNYAKPGEQGHRTDVRWLKIGTRKAPVFEISALGEPFGFNAWPYPQSELENKAHMWEMARAGAITYVVDADQMGMGGALPASGRRYALSVLFAPAPPARKRSSGKGFAK